MAVQFIVRGCFAQLNALVLEGSRVYHFGSCGMHVGKGQNCDGARPDTRAIENMLQVCR